MATRRDFETVFRTVFPRLVSLGVIKTGRVDVARDLAQETMLRAHARWDEVAEYASPEAWCHVVMTNLIIDAHRSDDARRRAMSQVDLHATASEPAPTIDRWNELVAPLTDRQRLVLTLYYAEDMPVAEIAHSLGTTTGGIKATLFKARRTLRRRLESERDHG